MREKIRNGKQAPYNGSSVAKDGQQTIAWYTRAAEQGDKLAQKWLDRCNPK